MSTLPVPPNETTLEPRRPAAARRAVDALPDSIRGASILVIDDTEANAVLLVKALESDGFEHVHAVTDPRRALEEIRRREPDLLLLDLRMPEVDGFAVLEALRSELRDPELLPVMVLTADSDLEARRRALREGALDFLTKPFDLQEVLQRTRNLLRVRYLNVAQRKNAERFERLSDTKAKALAQMTEDMRGIHHALEELNVDSLLRLARAAELRDDDTGKHTARVGLMAGAVARRLGEPAEAAELLAVAARLHDIGKLGVPDAILLKPGRFDAEERAVMERHCEIGAGLLAGGTSELLQIARTVALSHHERWDGQGYPNRLRGREIPLEARIVAVADTFDALTHARPYKRAWGVDEACDLITSERGRHFDPDVVDAFLGLLRDLRCGDPAKVPLGLNAYALLDA